ncbi:RNA polymerase sigma factor [Halobacillus naozhouensis]|uniref:Sigma-70 family RNA polymerase sigma factor n=1 Tax=Halobacillus naozhouensis TaxID=554880 RepID=A0ABY8J2C5_9BACI|nr:sigma-70 family RNA polymerase sigma factor [Halobacillus naozhouensis]WFT75116.1 sigma-70 family RNA polymerase sigma factor [Halobacillus naozhouensis]
MMDEDFDELYLTYYNRVYYSAYRVTKDQCSAEDVLQETFIKAYRNSDQLKDVEKIGAWLSTAATRTAIDLLRKERKYVVTEIEEVPLRVGEVASFRSTVEESCEQRELEEEVWKSTSSLSPKLKEIFKMKYYFYFKEAEIAKHLQLSPSAVKSRLYRARNYMKKQVEGLTEHDQTA